MGIKKKKYQNGTTPMGYIPSPEEAIAANDIRLARADKKANENVWASTVIPMAASILQNMVGGAGKSTVKTDTADATAIDKGAAMDYTGGSNNMTGTGNFMDMEEFMDGAFGKAYAAFGKSNIEGNVEVEGGEVIETAMGNQEVKGPSHENGGVDAIVPAGTKIFSDRLKGADGRTMAERKLARDKSLADIEKVLSNNTTDVALKNAHKRRKYVIEQEEQNDLMFQQMADMFNNVQSEIKKFAYGTGPDGTDPGFDNITFSKGYGLDKFKPFLTKYASSQKDPVEWGNVDSRKAFQKMIGATEDGIFGKDTLAKADSYYKNYVEPNPIETDSTILENISKGLSVESLPMNETAPNIEQGTTEKADSSTAGFGETAKNLGEKIAGVIPNMTTGDMLSLYGDYLGTTDPLKNVLENRAGDQPNINHFKEFGKDAIEAVQNQKGYVEGQKANALKRLNTSSAAAKNRLRGSARGVNTMRALDLGVELNKNTTEAQIYDNFMRQMMGIAGMEAGLENQQDQMVMSGEQQKDIADRQDRDNFYTQKGVALNAKSRGVQEMGKDVNKLYENEMYKNLINQMGKYFKFDSKGNIVSIKDSTK